MKSACSFTIAGALALTPTFAAAADFAKGSLIVPMDTTYQDSGMLEAYGLVYELLRQGVPVHWVIAPQKQNGGVDFMASGTDLRSGMAVPAHGYRGGPWVVDAADAAKAKPIVVAWQMQNLATAVHEATAPFTGEVSRTLVIAPNIAMMADGNQKIARKYMLAAKIPDSTGDPNWPDTSPDMLDPKELAGPTLDSHSDGALFDDEGSPRYCQFMSMHWAVKDAQQNPEVVAEMREFLGFPTHLFAECQAVNAFENLAPHGFFLTEKGFVIGQMPNTYDYLQQDSPYAQIDGAFLSVGGSEPAYSLLPGEKYKGTDIVMITQKGTPVGVNDVWMTGYLDGICPADAGGCLSAGKVSYLGGHEYDTALPISKNPKTQGVRLFLNSLFESPCASAEGLPILELSKSAPAQVNVPELTFDISYVNTGAMPALDATLSDTLPAGVTFVAATDAGMFADGTVTWQLGNVAPGEVGLVSVTVDLDAPGVYENTAKIDFRAGVNLLSVVSAPTMTEYVTGDTGGDTTDGGSTGGSGSAGTGGTGTGGTGTGGTGGSGGGTGDGSASGGNVPTGAGPTEGGTSVTGGGSEGSGGSAGGEDGSGCGCNEGARGPGLVALAFLALGLRRRRRG
jgi:uncharacterized repeat protein (TIGR01451 family)